MVFFSRRHAPAAYRVAKRRREPDSETFRASELGKRPGEGQVDAWSIWFISSPFGNRPGGDLERA
jgi:hypothetical protein